MRGRGAECIAEDREREQERDQAKGRERERGIPRDICFDGIRVLLYFLFGIYCRCRRRRRRHRCRGRCRCHRLRKCTYGTLRVCPRRCVCVSAYVHLFIIMHIPNRTNEKQTMYE